jgi:hypothetical protein
MSSHTSGILFARFRGRALTSSDAATPSQGSTGSKRGLRGSLPTVLATLVSLVALSAPASALASGTPQLAGTPLSDALNLSGATSVAVSGTIAYVTDYAGGQVTAVDISNPAFPVVVGTSGTPQTYLDNASTINIANGFAYVVSKNRNGPKISGGGTNDDGTGNTLTVLDIHTTPNTPTIVGHFTDAVNMFGAYGVAASGSFAYVAAQGCLAGQPCPNALVGNSFTVLNVSTPTPTLVTTLHNPTSGPFVNALDHADSVAISGNFAYVTSSYSNMLTVIDISNPAAPTIVKAFTDPAINFPVDVTVSGNFAYVVNQLSTPPNFTVVDISTPASPKVVGSVTNGFLNGAYRIRVHGNFAYVSGSSAHSIGVIDISNPTNPTLVAALSDAAHFNNTTGLDIDATGHLIVTSPFLPTESFSLYPPFPSPTGPVFATGTVSDVTLDPSAIGVRIAGSSEPAPITGQTAANFSFTTSDSVSTVLCQLDGGPMSPCTTNPTASTSGTQQYSGLAAGMLHTFTVQATDAVGNVGSTNYQWQINAGGAADSSLPTISGATVQGQVLTAATGSWSGTPAPTFTYIWQRCTAGVCNAIPGATAATYTLAAADVGSTINVIVTGSNNLGVDHATSAQTAAVTSPPPAPPPAPVAPANTALPTISGSPVVTKLLTASPGTWSGTPTVTYAYQWRSCNSTGTSCVAIAGATSSTYTPVSADAGSKLTVVVTATNGAGSASASATPTAVVAHLFPGQGNVTTTPVHITKLALVKSHGKYTLQVGLSGAGTVTVTLKRVHPHKATLKLKNAKHKVQAGANKITLQVPKAHHVTYTVVVTLVRSGAGTAATTSRSVTFSVK